MAAIARRLQRLSAAEHQRAASCSWAEQPFSMEFWQRGNLCRLAHTRLLSRFMECPPAFKPCCKQPVSTRQDLSPCLLQLHLAKPCLCCTPCTLSSKCSSSCHVYRMCPVTTVQSEVPARKAAATVVMTSFWYSGLTLTAHVRGTAQLLASVLSTLPVQAVRNAAFYAMQHLLDCLAVSSMLLCLQLTVSLCVCTELTIFKASYHVQSLLMSHVWPQCLWCSRCRPHP